MPIAALLRVFGGSLVKGFRLMLYASVTAFALKLMAAFGLYFFMLEPMVDDVRNYLLTQLTDLHSVAEWVGYFHIDRAVTILVSAYMVALAGSFVLKRRTA